MKCKPFSVKNLWRVTFGPVFLVALVGCSSVVSTKELFTSDRRSDGARITDVAIQLTAFNRLKEQFGRDRSGHIRVSSFNRQVLITGFVPDQSTKATVGQIIGRIENTRSPIINQLFVSPHTEDASSGIDKIFEERLLCDFARAGFDTRVTKVIVESGAVYLTGMVSAEESRKYAQLVSRSPGVRRVVLAYEVLTEDQAKAIDSVTLAKSKDSASLTVCTNVDASRRIMPGVIPVQIPQEVPQPSQRVPQLPPPAPEVSNAKDIEPAKKKCSDLGLKIGSEKFGECVLRLSK